MKSLAPGEGPSRCAYFPYCSTERGHKWHAYIAGATVWIVAHGRSRTSVCPHWFTDGEVCCTQCNSGELAHTVGYVPLYRDLDSRPCMVLVYDDARHGIDALYLHQRVVVGRDKLANATCYVVPALSQEPRFKTTLRERMQPADISRSLLAVWRNPAVASWYYASNGLPQPGPTLASTGDPTKPAMPRRARLAAELHTPPQPPPPVKVDATPAAEALSAALERAKAREKVAKNGKPGVTE